MGKHCDDPLHGVTVVVDTLGARVYIGRYHSETDEGILMMDVDVRDLDSIADKEPYLAKSAKFGVYKNTNSVRVPRSEVASVRRLVEYATDH